VKRSNWKYYEARNLRQKLERHARGLKATRGFSLADRLEFYSMPEPNSGCLLWLGGVDAKGYGQTFWQGVNWFAHQAAWMAAHGPIPAGMCVCHSCDVPSCINESHLWLGTNADNTADKTAKGRVARMRGEKNGFSKLKQEQADAIRTMPGTQAAIAAKFGVCGSLVGKIKRGENWRADGAASLARVIERQDGRAG
jgi:hypothetical protein